VQELSDRRGKNIILVASHHVTCIFYVNELRMRDSLEKRGDSFATHPIGDLDEILREIFSVVGTIYGPVAIAMCS